MAHPRADAPTRTRARRDVHRRRKERQDRVGTPDTGQAAASTRSARPVNFKNGGSPHHQTRRISPTCQIVIREPQNAGPIGVTETVNPRDSRTPGSYGPPGRTRRGWRRQATLAHVSFPRSSQRCELTRFGMRASTTRLRAARSTGRWPVGVEHPDSRRSRTCAGH